MTVLPLPLADGRVSIRDFYPVTVAPPIATDETEMVEPFDSTSKLAGSGNAVVCNFSSYVNVMLSPFVATEPVEYTGDV